MLSDKLNILQAIFLAKEFCMFFLHALLASSYPSRFHKRNLQPILEQRESLCCSLPRAFPWYGGLGSLQYLQITSSSTTITQQVELALYMLWLYIRDSANHRLKIFGKKKSCTEYVQIFFFPLPLFLNNTVQQIFTQHSQCIRYYKWSRDNSHIIEGVCSVSCKYYAILLKELTHPVIWVSLGILWQVPHGYQGQIYALGLG